VSRATRTSRTSSPPSAPAWDGCSPTATSSPLTTPPRRTRSPTPRPSWPASPPPPSRAVALGPRAGARVRRLGDGPALGHVTSRGPRQAPLDGFALPANVWVPPNDRARLEPLGRSLLRPPLAQDRGQLRADGRVLVTLKTVGRAGTSQLRFEPIEFLDKLAAILPTTTSHYTW
jgi:hypothetical protein